MSLTVAIVSTALAMLIGVTPGLTGGRFRGISGLLALGFVDILPRFPPVLPALLVVMLFGPGAVTLTACLAILFAPASRA